ncbi:neurotrypsin-like [Branchiostoma lanceolatum]|uniref:neurotrypsin-like n=1 Tax=Branchiostoma lanceolatum TaxID=7740 RepID=UPI003453336E
MSAWVYMILFIGCVSAPGSGPSELEQTPTTNMPQFSSSLYQDQSSLPSEIEKITARATNMRQFSSPLYRDQITLQPKTDSKIKTKDKSEHCQYKNGASYRGTVAVTKTGLTCQRWDSQTPHDHERAPADYPSSGLEENYCRNPDDEPGVWCYTTDNDTRWELCEVPVCIASYRGTVNVTETGKTCQRWDSQTPHRHDRTPANYPTSGLEQNFCRNPDDKSGVWCFTMDPNTSWELCDVQVCNESIRLVGGASVSEGRVEVCHGGQWGTVCNDKFGLIEANLVCRELGYPGATVAREFEAGSGPIWLDNVACGGSETAIGDCDHDGWGSHNCDHGEDAGVVCAVED